MTDEIIQELWRAKDRLAKGFDYDMDALAAEIQNRQKQTGRKVVNWKFIPLCRRVPTRTSNDPFRAEELRLAQNTRLKCVTTGLR